MFGVVPSFYRKEGQDIKCGGVEVENEVNGDVLVCVSVVKPLQRT